MTAAEREAIAAHVARLVAAAPPLRPEQRDRLAVLLRPTAGPTLAPSRGRAASGKPQPARTRRARDFRPGA